MASLRRLNLLPSTMVPRVSGYVALSGNDTWEWMDEWMDAWMHGWETKAENAQHWAQTA